MLALLVLSLLLLFSPFYPDSFIGDVHWGHKDLVGSSLVGVAAAFHFDCFMLDGLPPGDNIFIAPPLAAPSCVFALLWVDRNGMMPLIALPLEMRPHTCTTYACLFLFW
jgi:hypothetical protein